MLNLSSLTFVKSVLACKSWQDVRELAEKEQHQETQNSLRCPNCLRWTWQMKNGAVLSSYKDGARFSLYCSACGFKSEWLDTGFMGVCTVTGESPAKDRGIELKIGEIV